MGGSIPILAALITAVVWFNNEVAWADDVKRDQAEILLELQQLINASRQQQVEDKIEDYDYRKEKNGGLGTDDARELRTLEAEQERLKDEKTTLDKIEIELKKQ